MPDQTEWEDALSVLDDVRPVGREQRERILRRVLDLDRAVATNPPVELQSVDTGADPLVVVLRPGADDRSSVDASAGRRRSIAWFAAAAAAVIVLIASGALLWSDRGDDAPTAAARFPSTAAEQSCTQLRTTAAGAGLLTPDDPESALDAASIAALAVGLEAFTVQLRITAPTDGDDLRPWTELTRQLTQAEVFLRAGDRETAMAMVEEQGERFDVLIQTDDHPLVEACFADQRE